RRRRTRSARQRLRHRAERASEARRCRALRPPGNEKSLARIGPKERRWRRNVLNGQEELRWEQFARRFVHPSSAPTKEERLMSDFNPNLDPRRDPRNYDAYYEPSGSKGLTLVVGILVAIALVAGLMFFAGSPRDRTDQAQLPVQDRPL